MLLHHLFKGLLVRKLYRENYTQEHNHCSSIFVPPFHHEAQGRLELKVPMVPPHILVSLLPCEVEKVKRPGPSIELCGDRSPSLNSYEVLLQQSPRQKLD